MSISDASERVSQWLILDPIDLLKIEIYAIIRFENLNLEI